MEGDIEGARRELQLLEKVAARRLRIAEDLLAKMKGDVLKQLLLEQSKTKAELQRTKEKLKSVKFQKQKVLAHKRKRVDELLEEAKGWRASSVISARTEPEVKLGNKAGGRGDPFNDRFEGHSKYLEVLEAGA